MRNTLYFLLLGLLGCTAPHVVVVEPKPVIPVSAPPLSGTAALQNGPMIGYAEMTEALIWVQTKNFANVQVEYWVSGKPDQKWRTDPVQTYKSGAFTAKCIAGNLQPGTQYDYRLEINGDSVSLQYPTTFKTQALWQWRTDPPAFTLATGSCAYVNEPDADRPGEAYGSNFQIFNHISAQKPDLMLWLGDNVYFREVDWRTKSGMQHRYTHDRAIPELQPLLASTPHYAIWDDHDFGPDDSDGSWIMKESAWEVFRDFWGNPTFGLEGRKGCTTQFQFADVDFLLLDNRYFRTPDYCKTCPERTMLGKEQLQWLYQALAASRAPYKIIAVGGQILTTSLNNETASRFFPAEKDSILRFIEREQIKGVIFLTGDRHFSELSALKNASGNWVYDLTVSPLTSGAYADAATREVNQCRVEGTAVGEHNFGLLKFSGPRKARTLEMSLVNAEGKTLWTKTITPEGLR